MKRRGSYLPKPKPTAEQQRRRKTVRFTPDPFYTSKQWRDLKRFVLSRDMRLCVECERHGRTTAAECVDHIIPRRDGGSDHPDNLQSLCNRCHRRKTAREGNQSKSK